jgi:DNA-binding MarR family transcriptional regulator
MELLCEKDLMNDSEFAKIVLDWSTVFMRLSMHDFHRYVRATGQSLGQMNVLLHLYYKGPTEVMNFSDLMQVSHAGASQMVERMVQQGIVQRVESPDDRRVRMVHITDSGRRIVEDSISARRAWMENLMASLNPEEKKEIAQALLTLTEKAAQIEVQEAGTRK